MIIRQRGRLQERGSVQPGRAPMNEFGKAASASPAPVSPAPISAVLVTAASPASPAYGAPHTAVALARAGVELLGTVAAPGALGLVTAAAPEVVVVELDGCPDGLAAVASVVTAVRPTPVLTLTASADHNAVLAAVRAGATSHLVAATPAELAVGVRRTARGEAVFSPGLADVVLEAFGSRPDGRGSARHLTHREADVLLLVVEGLTARQIASRLVLSPRTVENHVQSVLRKLRLHSRAALVRYAIEQGLA
jgi:DNA-binding NarL/FixJ family response regulator